MKALSIILGILLIVGGVMSIINPASMLLSIGALIGLFVMAHGVGSLITYARLRPWGDGWGLAGAVLSIVLGALMMFSGYFRLFSNMVLVFIAGAWMLAVGVVCVVLAVRLLRLNRAAQWSGRSFGWGGLFFLGLILIGLGMLAYIHPVVSAMTVSVMLSIYIIAAGIDLIAVSCCRPRF